MTAARRCSGPRVGWSGITCHKRGCNGAVSPVTWISLEDTQLWILMVSQEPSEP